MIELEAASLTAALAACVHVGTPLLVPLPHCPPDLARDVPAALAWLQLGTALARRFFRSGPAAILRSVGWRPIRGAGLPFLELGHERTHGAQMHLFDRAARDRMGQEVLRGLEQVDVLLGRGELHLVALRCERGRGFRTGGRLRNAGIVVGSRLPDVHGAGTSCRVVGLVATDAGRRHLR